MDIDYEKVLDLEVEPHGSPKTTIRKYLHKLLSMVWEHRECFDGKRPFGMSDWEYDLYMPLVKAGYVRGSKKKGDDVVNVDTREGKKFVSDIIDYLFQKS